MHNSLFQPGKMSDFQQGLIQNLMLLIFNDYL